MLILLVPLLTFTIPDANSETYSIIILPDSVNQRCQTNNSCLNVDVISAHVGDRITLTNKSPTMHTIRVMDVSTAYPYQIFSGEIYPNNTWPSLVKFDYSGTYEFLSEQYPWVKATVFVEPSSELDSFKPTTPEQKSSEFFSPERTDSTTKSIIDEDSIHRALDKVLFYFQKTSETDENIEFPNIMLVAITVLSIVVSVIIIVKRKSLIEKISYLYQKIQFSLLTQNQSEKCKTEEILQDNDDPVNVLEELAKRIERDTKGNKQVNTKGESTTQESTNEHKKENEKHKERKEEPTSKSVKYSNVPDFSSDDSYRNLGVRPDTAISEIKQKYRELSKKYNSARGSIDRTKEEQEEIERIQGKINKAWGSINDKT